MLISSIDNIYETYPKTDGLYRLDNIWDTNLQVTTDVSGVTTTGFQIKINLQEDTILYGARIRWMACGKQNSLTEMFQNHPDFNNH